MKKVICWPQTEFTLKELMDLNPQFDGLTLQFFMNRKISDGSISRVGKSGEKYSLEDQLEKA